jgi:hypothetical protein
MESLVEVSRYDTFEITYAKRFCAHRFISRTSDVLCSSGLSHEFIQMEPSDSCHYIAIHIFRLVFCSRQCIICEDLRNEGARSDIAVPVSETDTERIDTDNIHPPS